MVTATRVARPSPAVRPLWWRVGFWLRFWTEVALGVGVLTAITFFNGSARVEATGQGAPPVDAGLITAGVVLSLTLAASLYASAKASDALARHQIAAHA